MRRYPHAVPVSAMTGKGLAQLAIAVSDSLSRGFREVDIEMGVDNGRLMAYLAAHGEILSRSYQDTKVTLHCRLPEKFLGPVKDEKVVIREHGDRTDSEYLSPSAMEDVA